jgi:hypothetical protein
VQAAEKVAYQTAQTMAQHQAADSFIKDVVMSEESIVPHSGDAGAVAAMDIDQTSHAQSSLKRKAEEPAGSDEGNKKAKSGRRTFNFCF